MHMMFECAVASAHRMYDDKAVVVEWRLGPIVKLKSTLRTKLGKAKDFQRRLTKVESRQQHNEAVAA